MRDYNITLEDIQKMLDQFIEGGEEAVTIQRTNPDTGLQKIVPFKELQSQRAAASIPSVSPKSNHLPGEVIHIGSDMGASTSRSGGAQADEQITVGNIHVVYDDELRTLMRDYNISAEEIKQMLALYAQGGAATITKDRINPEFGFREIVTLDFEKFISQKPSVPITSVTPTAGPPSHPPQDAIQHLLSTEAYLQEQIKELDAQFDALNVAYQWGVIIKQTRNKHAKINRDQRRRFETDLRYIQMEISRRGGTEQRRIPGSYITLEQRAALRQELLNIRRRKRIIFQLLRLLGNRNSRLLVPMVKDPFRQQLRRRVSFANGNRPKLTKTLSGSITGQDVPRRRVV
ncbi:uncharacterized protein [Magallana gigas]|uniref:uncharacterized protein isoform X1 n=1 Tax=Magallana gigas TaxID=29159 RepID=UPI00333EA4D3